MSTFDIESIRHLTTVEEIVHKYRYGLIAVTNKASLLDLLTYWQPLAAEAYGIASGFSDDDVTRLLEALAQDHEGERGLINPDYLEIARPRVMVSVTITASQYKVPFGAAFIRMVDVGLILVEAGIASVLPSTAAIDDIAKIAGGKMKKNVD